MVLERMMMTEAIPAKTVEWRFVSVVSAQRHPLCVRLDFAILAVVARWTAENAPAEQMPLVCCSTAAPGA